MRNLAFLGLGIFFVLIGLGLFALTLRKRKEPAATAKKAEHREHAALQEEAVKMRIGGAVAVVAGIVLLLLY